VTANITFQEFRLPATVTPHKPVIESTNDFCFAFLTLIPFLIPWAPEPQLPGKPGPALALGTGLSSPWVSLETGPLLSFRDTPSWKGNPQEPVARL